MSDQKNEEIQQNEVLIGDLIRAAREKKNVSVKIVAQHTKISSTNLEALEANDLLSLPNKAYVKGYVKSCAKLLGLNENECLNILQKNYDSVEKPTRIKEEKQKAKVEARRESNELIYKMIGVIAVVVILVVVISKQDTSKTTESVNDSEITNEEVIAEEQQVEVTPVVLSDSTPLKPDVEITPVPTIAPTPTATPTPVVEKKKEDKKEEDKEETVLRPISGTLYGFDSKASGDQLDEWLPSNFRVPNVEGKQNVFINATEGDTWLTYQVDGGDIKKFILKKDQKLLITGEEILLFLGNYRSTKIFLNNKLLEITSRSGVKSLIFPQENASEHFYPLFIFKDDGTVMNSKTYNKNNN